MREDIDYTPNDHAQDADGGFIDIWSPWEAMGLHYFSYNAQVDLDALNVLKGIVAKKYCNDIAEETGLAPSHVEMIQYLFCGANWCEYGTSPRGCWIQYGIDADQLIAMFEAYYEAHWGVRP
jgi:hypothetical protein